MLYAVSMIINTKQIGVVSLCDLHVTSEQGANSTVSQSKMLHILLHKFQLV